MGLGTAEFLLNVDDEFQGDVLANFENAAKNIVTLEDFILYLEQEIAKTHRVLTRRTITETVLRIAGEQAGVPVARISLTDRIVDLFD